MVGQGTPDNPNAPKASEALAAGVAPEVAEAGEAAALEAGDADDRRRDVAEVLETADAVAQRWIETIPAADRDITSRQQLDALVELCVNSRRSLGKAHVFASSDKVVNMPRSIASAYKYGKGDAVSVLAAVRDFLENPMQFADETDKLIFITKSSLPDSVQKALITMALDEGSRSTVELFSEWADTIDAMEDGDDLSVLYTSIMRKAQEGVGDQFRVDANRIFLEAVYPELSSSPEFELMIEMDSVPHASLKDPRLVADIVQCVVDVVGTEHDFAKYTDVDTLAPDMQRAPGALRAKVRPAMLFQALKGALKAHLGRLVQGGAIPA